MKNNKDKSKSETDKKSLLKKKESKKSVSCAVKMRRNWRTIKNKWLAIAPYLINALEFVLIYISILSAVFLTLFQFY